MSDKTRGYIFVGGAIALLIIFALFIGASWLDVLAALASIAVVIVLILAILDALN